jgi:Domain of unknown function (DUF5602)
MSEKKLVVSAHAAVAAACIAALVLSCRDSTSPATQTLIGPDVSVGSGIAHTEVVFDGDVVTAANVVFTEAALTNLPATLPGSEFLLPLPTGAPATVFNHVTLNWNPQGHPPPMVYTVPHFDVHYYFISPAQRSTMTPADPAFAAKAALAPPADQIPPNYVADRQPVPMMGTHYTDATSQEFHGQPFTNTLVYGFYQGAMIFIEPMFSKAFVDTQPMETRAIPVPAKYPAAGRYPTSYTVSHDAAAKVYRISLTGFVTRN